MQRKILLNIGQVSGILKEGAMEKNNKRPGKESHSARKLFRSTFLIHFFIIILTIAFIPSSAQCAFFKKYYIWSHGRKVYVSDKYYDAIESGNRFARGDQYDQAIAEYTKAIDIGPKYPFAYVNRGLVYIEKGKFDQAILDLNKAIEVDQKCEDAYFHRGGVYVGKGQYDQAISDFTKAIKLEPKFAKAYFRRGIAYCQKGQVDLGISDLNKAREHPDLRKPADKAIEKCTGKQEKAVPESPSGWLSMIRSVGNDFQTGLNLFENKDYGGAVEKLTRAIDNIPVADKMYEASREALDADSSIKWDSLKSDGVLYAKAIRSQAYLFLGKYDEAKSDANSVVVYYNKIKCTREDSEELCKGSVERAMFVRGAVHQKEGNYEQAIRDYDWVVKNGKMLGWNAYERRGRVYFALKDSKIAYIHFDKLVQQYPTSAEYHALRCIAGYDLYKNTKLKDSEKVREERRKRLEEISADCEKALEIDPNNQLAQETEAIISIENP